MNFFAHCFRLLRAKLRGRAELRECKGQTQVVGQRNHSEPDVRRGTRIKTEISIILTSLDAGNPFSQPALTILVDPQGCAVRFGRPLEIGAAVQLEGLPTRNMVTARVVNCISPGKYEKFWILGLALDEPGNVWGIETPPEDWSPKSL